MPTPRYIVTEYELGPITDFDDVPGLSDVDWSTVESYSVKWGTLYHPDGHTYWTTTSRAHKAGVDGNFVVTVVDSFSGYQAVALGDR